MRDSGRITRPSHVLLQRGWESRETMPNSGLVSTPLSHSCSFHSCRTQHQTRSSTVWYNTEQALGLTAGSAFYAWLNSYFTPPYWDRYFLLLVYYSDVKVQFSRSVICDSLRPHSLQHARPPCLLLTPGAYSNSCPLSWWCHPTISSSVVPFSSHLQSFPASGSFQMSQFFASGGKSTGVSASASVLVQWIFRTDLLQDGLVWSHCCPKDSQESSSTPQFNSINFSVLSFLYSPTLTSIRDYWKNHSFD